MERLRDAICEAARPARGLLKDPLKYSEFFFGLGGFKRVLHMAEIPAESVFLNDSHPAIKEFHRKLDGVDSCSASVVSSKDIHDVTVDDIAASNIIVGGPPCNGWADNGPRNGVNHPLGPCFVKFVDLIIAAAKKGNLLAFAIENSKNITRRMKGEEEPIATYALRRFRQELPYFDVTLVMSELELMVASTRNRAWIRGCRYDVLLDDLFDERKFGAVPRPYLKFDCAQVSLAEILDYSLPNVNPSSITAPGRAKNLREYEALIKKEVKEKKIVAHFAIFDIDRKIGGRFREVLMYDQIPPMRLKGPEFFLISCIDLDKQWSDKVTYRFLTNSERFTLQGHPHSMSTVQMSGRFHHRVIGNAYATPMVAAVMVPIINKIGWAESVEGMKRYRPPFDLKNIAEEVKAAKSRKISDFGIIPSKWDEP